MASSHQQPQIREDVFAARIEAAYPPFAFSDKDHPLRSALRGLFRAAGKDPENPFADLAQPGGTVVLKPNWVIDFNPLQPDIDCLVTHTAFVKYAIDWAARALDGRGTIVVADAPVQSCNFARLLERTRARELIVLAQTEYPRVNFLLEDWRLTTLSGCGEDLTPGDGSVQEIRNASADGYVLHDCGKESFLEEIADYSERFRVSCYQPSLMLQHHRPGKHEYLVARRALSADLVVNLAKMKTHMKAGLTGALKNLVGINGHKEFLPHYVLGDYFSGGDCHCQPNWFKRRYDRLYDYFWENFATLPPAKRWWTAQVMRACAHLSRWTGGDRIPPGAWAGNETVWRTTLDLNHLLYFGGPKPPRVFNIVDGIVAGEGNGPLSPSPKPAGIVAIGENPACIDAVLAWLMGYNLARVPTVYHALHHRSSRFAPSSPDEFPVWFGSGGTASPVRTQLRQLPNLNFRKPRFWRRADRQAV